MSFAVLLNRRTRVEGGPVIIYLLVTGRFRIDLGKARSGLVYNLERAASYTHRAGTVNTNILSTNNASDSFPIGGCFNLTQ